LVFLPPYVEKEGKVVGLFTFASKVDGKAVILVYIIVK
jgi:hypothetical protein